MYAGEKTVFDIYNITTLYRFSYLPWCPWVVQHRQDRFYFCCTPEVAKTSIWSICCVSLLLTFLPPNFTNVHTYYYLSSKPSCFSFNLSRIVDFHGFETGSRGAVFTTLHFLRNLRMGQISQSVCSCRNFSDQSNDLSVSCHPRRPRQARKVV